MARGKRAKAEAAGTDSPPPATIKPRLPLPSPKVTTNLVIADIVMRAAGGLLRDRLEQGLITRQSDGDAAADRQAAKRGFATSAVLWGASHIARRSPLGLAVVAGGLAAKVLYDRGKQIEGKRRGKSKAPPEAES